MGGDDPRALSDDEYVLAINAGSSSLKCALFQWVGTTLRNGGYPTESSVSLPALERLHLEAGPGTESRTAAGLQGLLERHSIGEKPDRLRGVGHRIVHGGTRYTQPAVITPEILADLRQLTPLAPEHEPAELDLVATLLARLPSVPQVACFDTAFHRDLPRRARLLPIPRRYFDAGIRRYGFHGLSYEFLMEELVRLGDPAATHGRVILAHLGNGASLAAVRDGKCVDTSMAFTPAAGLVMGRRSGDLDPGLVSYLARMERMTPQDFDAIINHESGMLGVSETSSDMRELLALESTDSRAADAIALFCYQASKWIGAFAVALGGVDTIVFAGGIGEHCAPVRQRICADLGFLGVDFDHLRNDAQAPVISKDASRLTVRVIPTDEELMIARSVCRVLALGTSVQKSTP